MILKNKIGSEFMRSAVETDRDADASTSEIIEFPRDRARQAGPTVDDIKLLQAIAVTIHAVAPLLHALSDADAGRIETALADPFAFAKAQFDALPESRRKWFDHHTPLASALYFLKVPPSPLDSEDRRSKFAPIYAAFDALPDDVRLGIGDAGLLKKAGADAASALPAPARPNEEEQAARLFSIGVEHFQTGAFWDSIAVWESLVAKFGDSQNASVLEYVLGALFNKGVALGQLGQADAEIEAYDALIDRFAEATEPALREQVAKAMLNQGITLGQLGQSAAAIAVYDALIDRLAEATEPALREQLAKAMLNKGGLAGLTSF